MTKPDPLTGQLSLFATETATAKRTRRARPRRKPQRQPQWLGPGRCRSCGHRLPLYQGKGYLLAWCHETKALVPACPACGIAITTTTTDLIDEQQGEAS